MNLKLVKCDEETYLMVDELIAEQQHKLLARWAKACSLRTIRYFSDAFPDDDRLVLSLAALDEWLSGDRTMWETRKTVLQLVLPAARDAKAAENFAAEAAARAVGHAVATCHVATHSPGGALYALTAIRRATDDSQEAIQKEREWQKNHLAALSSQILSD